LDVELALVGHTDTVPFDPNWSEATNLTERDGKLYGRGSCDTKGFIAAALTAVETIDRAQLKKPLALIFTADEEIGLRGAKELAQSNFIHPRYSIVGEPTSLKPIRAGKGYSLAEVVVKGREAHSRVPRARRLGYHPRRTTDHAPRKDRRKPERPTSPGVRSSVHNAEYRSHSWRLRQERPGRRVPLHSRMAPNPNATFVARAESSESGNSRRTGQRSGFRVRSPRDPC
jgi:hypothetical protein